MQKRILIITEYYNSGQNTTGYLFEKLIEAFNSTSQFDLNLLVRYDDRIGKEIENDSTFYVKAGFKSKGNLFKRFCFEFNLAYNFFIKSLFLIRRGQIVFTGTTPIFLLVVICILKKVINFKWVLLVHDIFPENLIPSKIMQPEQLIYKIIKKVFDYIYSQPDKIITIGKDMKELIMSKTKKNDNDIDIVRNWINHSDIEIQSRHENRILKELGWQDCPETIFYYFGNIGYMQGVDVVLEAIEKMKYRDMAKFIFIGGGAFSIKLKDLIKQKFKGSDSICYLEAISAYQKSDGLNAGDIALVTLNKNMWGLGVPSKTYFSMAADKHILAIMDKNTEVADMVVNKKIGWHVGADDSDLIAKKLDEISMLKHHWKKDMNSPREILIGEYSEKKAMEKILLIVNSI